MKNHIIYLIFFLIPLIGGCVSDFNAELPSDDLSLLVVDGDIIANSVSVFYLTKTYSLNESKVPAASQEMKANLYVVGTDGYISEGVYLGSGKYQVSVGDLKNDQKYGIKINYNGNTYISEPSAPLSTPPIDSISWKQSTGGDELVSLHVSTHGDASTGFYKWNYREDWEIESPFLTVVMFDLKMARFYEDLSLQGQYCWKKNDINALLLGSTESLVENRIVDKKLIERFPFDDRFSLLYSLTVTQKALSQSGYEYFQNQSKLSEGMGGLFTPQPSEVKGNIFCPEKPELKVIGYVETLKNISQQRMFIRNNEINRRIISICSILDDPEILSNSNSDIYKEGYRPVGFTLDDFKWAPAKCVDCIVNGGTKNKPDFWPNDHK